MSLPVFLRNLYESGRVTVPRQPPPRSAADDVESHEAVFEVERLFRQEMPGQPPPLQIEPAIWGCTMLYAVCRLLVYRDLGLEDVNRELSGPGPKPDTPAAIYSVDLSFRFLPDVVRLCRAAGDGDPLTDRVLTWCREWPLSSVGVADVGTVRPEVLLLHPSLRIVYVDRIIRYQDHTRLANPSTRLAVREAVGIHTPLLGSLAEYIAEPSHTG